MEIIGVSGKIIALAEWTLQHSDIYKHLPLSFHEHAILHPDTCSSTYRDVNWIVVPIAKTNAAHRDHFFLTVNIEWWQTRSVRIFPNPDAVHYSSAGMAD